MRIRIRFETAWQKKYTELKITEFENIHMGYGLFLERLTSLEVF